MTNQELVRILKGSAEDKKKLYDDFFNKVSQGEVLSELEVMAFEALKKEFTIVKQVIDMSADLKGSAFLKGN